MGTKVRFVHHVHAAGVCPCRHGLRCSVVAILVPRAQAGNSAGYPEQGEQKPLERNCKQHAVRKMCSSTALSDWAHDWRNREAEGVARKILLGYLLGAGDAAAVVPTVAAHARGLDALARQLAAKDATADYAHTTCQPKQHSCTTAVCVTSAQYAYHHTQSRASTPSSTLHTGLVLWLSQSQLMWSASLVQAASNRDLSSRSNGGLVQRHLYLRTKLGTQGILITQSQSLDNILGEHVSVDSCTCHRNADDPSSYLARVFVVRNLTRLWRENFLQNALGHTPCSHVDNVSNLASRKMDCAIFCDPWVLARKECRLGQRCLSLH
jgi:hypothetical protein